MDKMMRVDCAFEIKAVSDDGRIEGYGAVFGNIDFGLDRIDPGAFSDWLQGGTKSVPMLWQHYTDRPIGVWDRIKEDRKGLYVSGQLNLSKESGTPDVPQAWEARALAKQGAVTGLSIGYFPTKWSYEEEVRVLEKVDVMEVSMATFPMNDRARVIGVKNATRGELERALRDNFGLNKRAAIAFMDQGFKGLTDPEAGRRPDPPEAVGEEAIEVAARLRQLADRLRA